MSGTFDKFSGENTDVVTTTDAGRILTVLTTTPADSGPNIRPEHKGEDDSNTVTDTVAAIVSAVLALVFIIVLVCIIRVIRKRRRERQGQRLSQPVVQTIAPGAFGANAAAYRNVAMSAASQVPISGSLSWESVATSQAPVPRSQALEESLSTILPSEEASTSSSNTPVTLSATALIHSPPSSEIIAGCVSNTQAASASHMTSTSSSSSHPSTVTKTLPTSSSEAASAATTGPNQTLLTDSTNMSDSQQYTGISIRPS